MFKERHNLLLQILPRDIVNEIHEYTGHHRIEWTRNLMKGVLNELSHFNRDYSRRFEIDYNKNILSTQRYTMVHSCYSTFGITNLDRSFVMNQISGNHYNLDIEYYIVMGYEI